MTFDPGAEVLVEVPDGEELGEMKLRPGRVVAAGNDENDPDRYFRESYGEGYWIDFWRPGDIRSKRTCSASRSTLAASTSATTQARRLAPHRRKVMPLGPTRARGSRTSASAKLGAGSRGLPPARQRPGRETGSLQRFYRPRGPTGRRGLLPPTPPIRD